jgi:hypothetical protein
MLRRPLDQQAPGNQFRHPRAVLRLGRSGMVAREMLSFPSTKRGTDFVPVVHSRPEVSQHSSLKVAELTDFKR